MFLENRTPTYLKKLKEELEEIGIPIVMMTTYPDFTHPSSVQRERELLYLKGDVALCSEIGIQYLRILAGQAHPESSAEDCVDWVDGYFHQIDLCAKAFGVNLVFAVGNGVPGMIQLIQAVGGVPQAAAQVCKGIQQSIQTAGELVVVLL